MFKSIEATLQNTHTKDKWTVIFNAPSRGEAITKAYRCASSHMLIFGTKVIVNSFKDVKLELVDDAPSCGNSNLIATTPSMFSTLQEIAVFAECARVGTYKLIEAQAALEEIVDMANATLKLAKGGSKDEQDPIGYSYEFKTPPPLNEDEHNTDPDNRGPVGLVW